MSSLRFRLPALFLAGIALAGLVAAAIAFRLFQDYTRAQSLRELRREARGVAELYLERSSQIQKPPELTPEALERATGDRLFFVGVSLFPGQKTGLRELSRRDVNFKALESRPTLAFEFTPRGEHQVFLAVGRRLQLGGSTFGAIVVAKPKSELNSELAKLLARLAIAFLVGIVVATGLAWYLSRRITRPVLALSAAADEIAEGRYGVSIPPVPGGGEIDHLADRFEEMAVRLSEAEALERNFLMTVSHELRTPLTAIRGHVEALREGIAGDAAAREASLGVIAAETARLERLVGDVLDLAKLDAHRFMVLREEVQMDRLVTRAYTAFAEEARRRGIDYRRDVGARPVIVSDGDRVLQIISNLLSNAFRWTPDNGRIAVELSAADGVVSVAVEDTGPGIPREEREWIFRPFWSRDGAGTGLGLAIAHELALALGGRIELETSPGRGSRFELVLPAESP
jgi:two-component system sensor histidine kinase BaeS